VRRSRSYGAMGVAVLAALGLVLAGCTGRWLGDPGLPSEGTTEPAGSAVGLPPHGVEYAPDRVLVKFFPDTPEEVKAQVHRRWGGGRGHPQDRRSGGPSPRKPGGSPGARLPQ
jgi:hypothetical protein